jgi:hypothetical protein
MHSSSSRVLCISGVPGTGKTASVMKVLLSIQPYFKNTVLYTILGCNGFEELEVNNQI